MSRKLMILGVLFLLLVLVGNAPASLVTHYSLDGTSGSTANDDSGNGNNGTVSDHSWGATGAMPTPAPMCT